MMWILFSSPTSLLKRRCSPERAFLAAAFQCSMQKRFQDQADPNDRAQQALLDEMKQHIAKVRTAECCRSQADSCRRLLSDDLFILFCHLPEFRSAILLVDNFSSRRCERMRTPGFLSPPLSSRKLRGPSRTTSRYCDVTTADKKLFCVTDKIANHRSI